MGKFQDLRGRKFGRLTVLERAENAKNKHVRWLCRCQCGNVCVVHGSDLRRGRTQSCGCLHLELKTRHGLRHDKIYDVWNDVKKRCLKPKCKEYKNYGGRGITLYEPWINDFKAFYEYVSQLEHFGEEGYSLDRIDNDGNYEPGNLRWATKTEQNRNRRDNLIVEYNGEKMTLAEAAEISGINYGTLKDRYRRGDRGERLFRPVQEHKK